MWVVDDRATENLYGPFPSPEVAEQWANASGLFAYHIRRMLEWN